MKKIIILLAINILAIPLMAQTFNLFSGSGAGYNVVSGNDYNVAYGDSAFFESGSSYITAFGTFAAYYANDRITSIGYKAGGAITDGLSIGVSSSGFLGNSQYNTTIGHNSGISLISGGKYNVLIGEETGYSLTTQDYVIAIGHQAAYSLGSSTNIFIGHKTGYHLTTSSQANIMIGNATTDYGSGAAGYLLTTGSYNILLGASSGSSLTASSYNTFLGTAAGGLTEVTEPNTFIGGLSGYNTGKSGITSGADYNTFVGYKSGYSNEDGRYNTIVGHNADVLETDLDRIVQVGAETETQADRIVLIGYKGSSLAKNTTGIGNEISMNGEYSVGIGYQTTIDYTGDHSTSIGYQSAMTGDSSVGIGYLANVQSTTSIAIGSEASATGTNATILGMSNTVSGDNAMAIGYNISIANDNQINIGNDAVMSISGIVNWTTTSDGRLKTNVQEDIPGLDFILKLRPVTYQLTVDGKRWTDARSSLDEKNTMNETVNCQAKRPSTVNRFTGFIAQEVEQTANSINYIFSGIDQPKNENDRYGLRYGQFVVPLVKATQELSNAIQKSEQVAVQTKNQVKNIDALLNEIEAQLSDEKYILSSSFKSILIKLLITFIPISK